MSDSRTRRQKLAAMARQSRSPREAEVARRMLGADDGNPMLRPPRKKLKPQNFHIDKNGEWVWDDDSEDEEGD